MHPPLHRPHELCEHVVRALIACHEEHRIGKFFGACNTAKRELDDCFRKEKEIRRNENMKKAREFDAKFEEFLKQSESSSSTTSVASSSAHSSSNITEK